MFKPNRQAGLSMGLTPEDKNATTIIKGTNFLKAKQTSRVSPISI